MTFHAAIALAIVGSAPGSSRGVPVPLTVETAPHDTAHAPHDTAHALPSGLELLHLTPAGQPPLDVLDIDHFVDLRDAFNASSDRVRVALLLSPTCPHCLQGAELIQEVFADSAATPLRIFVLWMHVTHSDRQPPSSLVLAKLSDRRAIQWWDPYRLLSKAMLRDYPPDTTLAMADTTGTPPPVIWDFVAMWGPGVRWTDRVPLPDFYGHPVEEMIPTFRRRLGELARPSGTPAPPSRTPRDRRSDRARWCTSRR